MAGSGPRQLPARLLCLSLFVLSFWACKPFRPGALPMGPGQPLLPLVGTKALFIQRLAQGSQGPAETHKL